MNKFLETYNLPTLNQEEIQYLNKPMTSSEIEIVTKKLPTNNSGSDSFTGEFYQTFKRVNLSFLNYPKNTEEEESLPNSFCVASITLIPNQTKTLQIQNILGQSL